MINHKEVISLVRKTSELRGFIMQLANQNGLPYDTKDQLNQILELTEFDYDKLVDPE